MKTEEIIEFDGIINLSNKESLEIKDLENLNKEFQNEFLCRIFDSSYYMNVNYIFDYSKVLELFNEYETKYGQPSEWDKNILTYNYWENGGVSDIDSIKKCKVNIDEIGYFIGAICMEAHGKKQFGWGDKAFYRIELYNYQTGLVNVNIDCTNHEIAYEFLNKLISCIVDIDKNDLTKRIYKIMSEINNSLETINKLSNILKND